MYQGPYADPSVSSLSLDQSKHLDSPNGKITPAVLLPLMPNRHFLVKLWKCRKAVCILPHEAKALLEVFCFQPIVIGERQNSSSRYFASWGKIKIHDFTLADQDWTRTEKFHSPLISGNLFIWDMLLISKEPDFYNQNKFKNASYVYACSKKILKFSNTANV